MLYIQTQMTEAEILGRMFATSSIGCFYSMLLLLNIKDNG